MLTKQISLTMPKKLYDDAVQEVKIGGYRGVQDLVLAVLRRHLAEERRYRRIETEMHKGKKITMTKEQALAYLRKI